MFPNAPVRFIKYDTQTGLTGLYNTTPLYFPHGGVLVALIGVTGITGGGSVTVYRAALRADDTLGYLYLVGSGSGDFYFRDVLNPIFEPVYYRFNVSGGTSPTYSFRMDIGIVTY